MGRFLIQSSVYLLSHLSTCFYLSIHQVIVWVDPLDGTKEFTEGTQNIG